MPILYINLYLIFKNFVCTWENQRILVEILLGFQKFFKYSLFDNFALIINN